LLIGDERGIKITITDEDGNGVPDIQFVAADKVL